MSELPDVELSQWWSRAEIADYQAYRIRAIVAHAFERSPFYRDAMQTRGLRPESIQGPDDLAALPIVRRGDIVREYDRIVVPDEVAAETGSGGTTGHRLRWAYSARFAELGGACLFRGLGWSDLRRDARVLLAATTPRIGTLFPCAMTIAATPKRSELDGVLERTAAFGPNAVYGFPSMLHTLARRLVERDETLAVAVCVTTSELLPPAWRADLERAFACPVYDNYGCNDGGVWGAQCETRHGFHQDVERAYLELVDGRMVTTDLWNTAFPFLRYENGDRGDWLAPACPCGRSSPRFELHGRTPDMIVTRSRVIGPTEVAGCFRCDGFDEFRVVQTSADAVEVVYVANERLTDELFAPYREQAIELFDGLAVTFRRVEAIPRPLSGKVRMSVNLVPGLVQAFRG